MATVWDVNLSIQSYVGFKRPDGVARGGYSAPKPILQTVKSLEALTDSPITGFSANGKMLLVNSLDPFIYIPGTTSTSKLVILSNVGNSSIILASILSSDNFATAIYDAALPVVIPAGSQYSFNLRYNSEYPGEYANTLIFVSSADSPYLRLNTQQWVGETFDYTLTDSTFITTTTVFGQQSSKTVELLPVVNGVLSPETVLSFSTDLVAGPGWSVTTGTNSATLLWDPDLVKNTNNTSTGYPVSLTIIANSVTRELTGVAYVDIDYSKYKNLATWMSAPSANNSIVGMSLDLINDVKTLTIGVGIGANGAPGLAEGGITFAQVTNLGISASTIERLYPYWTNVYAIPLADDVPATYLSGAMDANDNPLYTRKATAGYNYADYFGNEQGLGSIFKVDYNGSDNIAVSINNLRDVSGDPEFDVTLDNLTRAFHYYSAVDTNRYYQLEPLSNDTNVTHLFRGFISSYSEGATIWSVDVSTVELPT